ncbi:hypothetical protein [Psychroflexus planctonicus]|uniref:DUF304 domain-containing protein n=1 Tax=Psychroflexus planctonicus TaxID=1526575 RepID=A0ABQ1SJ13_9FLAO|nr:hypothetical protein [Psychroflexus planctonicus]GGE37524.1 hypothetical protein GCM10010832_17190 [Psychroflexus planctonicus]
MKNIHFDNLYSKWYYIPVLSVSVLLIASFILFRESEYAHLFYIFSTVLSVSLITRNFWYKAYVQYNSNRISIRINTSSQINLKFDGITKIEHQVDQLLITENAKVHLINIQHINPEDVQKLVNLLVERTSAFYEDIRELTYYK